jgi:transcription elongation factor GreA
VLWLREALGLFKALATGLRQPDVRVLKVLPGGVVMSDRIPMTRAGYNKIKAEIEEMENVQMPEIEKRIATARSEGDLSENAEYHGARESQGMLQAKINMLKAKLVNATIVDVSKLPKDQVAFSCRVVVKDLEFGDTEEFVLVGAGEEDYDHGKINITSPLAQGLLGKKVGEQAEVEVPAGINRFEILEIHYDA